MTNTYSSTVTKKLAFRSILDNIDYHKRSACLQDIISLGKISDIWRQALVIFLDLPLNSHAFKAFSKN